MRSTRSAESLIGKKYDIYYKDIEQWWPCTVIDADKLRIKVKYMNYFAAYEWIELDNELRSDRIANINQYTTKHQIHKTLINEQIERKSEWQINSKNLTIESILLSTEIKCVYFKRASKIFHSFVSKYNIDIGIFQVTGNRCFCNKCHEERKDNDTYSRGDPSQIYVLPIGYARFGIQLSQKQTNVDILKKWHVVYHGTKSLYLKEICDSGLILIKAKDFKLNERGPKHDNIIEIQPNHIQKPFERINKYTKKKELFNPLQIYTSPSFLYSSYYCDKIDIDGFKISFMFQCRQKPATYKRGQETMGFGDTTIDKYISNDSIEFYAKNSLNIAITGIMIKIHNFQSK